MDCTVPSPITVTFCWSREDHDQTEEIPKALEVFIHFEMKHIHIFLENIHATRE